MTREAFLKALENALASMQEEERAGVLSYYDEILQDRMEAGMSEEEAVRSMEPIEVIAARVLDEAEPAMEENEQNSNVTEVSRLAADYNHVIIRAQNREVRIESAVDDTIKIRYQIGGNDVFELHDENGTLTLEHQNRPIASFANEAAPQNFTLDSLLKGIGSVLNSIGEFGRNVLTTAGILSDESSAIVLTLPRAFCGAVTVENRNARVVAENINCSGDVRVATSNGRITLTDVGAGSISAVTANARVEMSNVYARSSLEAMTSNGRISAVNVLSDVQLRLETSNGQVETELIDAPEIRIATSNAGVNGTVKGPQSLYRVHTRVSNGTSSLADTFAGERSLDILTSNGSINVSFAEEEAEETETEAEEDVQEHEETNG